LKQLLSPGKFPIQKMNKKQIGISHQKCAGQTEQRTKKPPAKKMGGTLQHEIPRKMIVQNYHKLHCERKPQQHVKQFSEGKQPVDFFDGHFAIRFGLKITEGFEKVVKELKNNFNF
jgi:hypothetical protein